MPLSVEKVRLKKKPACSSTLLISCVPMKHNEHEAISLNVAHPIVATDQHRPLYKKLERVSFLVRASVRYRLKWPTCTLMRTQPMPSIAQSTMRSRSRSKVMVRRTWHVFGQTARQRMASQATNVLLQYQNSGNIRGAWLQYWCDVHLVPVVQCNRKLSALTSAKDSLLPMCKFAH